MAKFRQRPAEVEAVQFTGSNAFEVWAFMGRADILSNPEFKTTDWPVIHTLEGVVRTSPGDWIVRCSRHSYSVCVPDDFMRMYEAIEP